MNSIWVLSVRTTADYGEKGEEIKVSAYKMFADAREAMRACMRKYAFETDNVMFDRDGHISYLTEYIEEKCSKELSYSVNLIDMGNAKKKAVINVLRNVFGKEFPAEEMIESLPGIIEDVEEAKAENAVNRLVQAGAKAELIAEEVASAKKFDEQVLDRQVWEHLTDSLRDVFAGREHLIAEKGFYTDQSIAVEYKGDSVSVFGFDDSPDDYDEVYDPEIRTNCFSMEEEKDYYLYLKDQFGTRGFSTLYIDLKRASLQ